MSDNELQWNLGQDDPHDHYPWVWTPYLDDNGGPDVGSIHTPNGRRPDESMHTFWGVAHQVWEPHGHLICRLVNEWAHEQFGTALPATADGAGVTPAETHHTAAGAANTPDRGSSPIEQENKL